MDAQADLGLHCPHMLEDTFLHGAAHVVFPCTEIYSSHNQSRMTKINCCGINPCHAYPAFANSVDPGQLAFKKPADLDLLCSPLSM